ncbi:hypothetical protein BDQ17DRAFT_1440991 [Cyathus striatus]|nr:hypothetical protein BDQ17DRAFT_1440991 [Cyathus striatus]
MAVVDSGSGGKISCFVHSKAPTPIPSPPAQGDIPLPNTPQSNPRPTHQTWHSIIHTPPSRRGDFYDYTAGTYVKERKPSPFAEEDRVMVFEELIGKMELRELLDLMKMEGVICEIWTTRRIQRYKLDDTTRREVAPSRCERVWKDNVVISVAGEHPQSWIQKGLWLPSVPRSPRPRPQHLYDAFPRKHPGMSVWEAVAMGFDGGFVSKGLMDLGTYGRWMKERERVWDERRKKVWSVLEALAPPSSPQMNEKQQDSAQRPS